METLLNYAVRKDRTPLVVDLDPRYSHCAPSKLKNLPGCLMCSQIDFADPEDGHLNTNANKNTAGVEVFPATESYSSLSRVHFFFGRTEWAEDA